jgi:hypothetical protein
MWYSLSHPDLLTLYQGNFPGRMAPPGLLRLLAHIQAQAFADKVFAVTSLGHLRLTTGESYAMEEEHDVIAINPSGDGYSVAYVEAGRSRATTSRLCSGKELADVVECYLLRLLLHTPSPLPPYT